jgi:hypothetical protein
MINLNKIRNENQRLKSQGGNSSFLDQFVKMPEGTGFVTVRILPPGDGFDLPFAVTRTHRLGMKNFHCLCTLVGDRWEGRCPTCEFYRFLWRESDGTTDQEAKDKFIADARGVKPIERCYYNVIVREPGSNVGPKILSIGKQLHRLITVAMAGDPEDPNDPGLGDITDLQHGRDLKIKKTITKGPEGSYPSYTESKFLGEFVAGTQAEITQWLASLHDLAGLRQVKTAEELRKEIRIFRGLEKDPSTSFDEEDFRIPVTTSTPVVTPTKPSVTKPVVEDTDLGLAEEDYLADLQNM